MHTSSSLAQGRQQGQTQVCPVHCQRSRITEIGYVHLGCPVVAAAVTDTVLETVFSELSWGFAGFMRQLESFVDNFQTATKESSDDD